jgi:hypothetical protein
MENLEAFEDKARRLAFEWSTWVGSIDILVISSNFHTNLFPLTVSVKNVCKNISHTSFLSRFPCFHSSIGFTQPIN